MFSIFFFSIAEHSMYDNTLTPLLLCSLIKFSTWNIIQTKKSSLKLCKWITINYRFLVHNCQSLLSQKFKLCGVFSQVRLRSYEHKRNIRTVMGHFWDPLELHIPQTGGVRDWETDEEHILKQISARQRTAMSLQYPDMKVVEVCHSLPFQPCPIDWGWWASGPPRVLTRVRQSILLDKSLDWVHRGC